MVVVAVIAYAYGKAGKKDNWTRIAYVCITGGAIGNLIDRIRLARSDRFSGRVRGKAALAGLQCGRCRHFYRRCNAAGLANEKKVIAPARIPATQGSFHGMNSVPQFLSNQFYVDAAFFLWPSMMLHMLQTRPADRQSWHSPSAVQGASAPIRIAFTGAA